jgi:hypothetical protein
MTGPKRLAFIAFCALLKAGLIAIDRATGTRRDQPRRSWDERPVTGSEQDAAAASSRARSG